MCRRRRGLSAAVVRDAGVAVAARLRRTAFFEAAVSVAAYLSVEGEVDTTETIEAAFSSSKIVYLPRVTNPSGFVRCCREVGLRTIRGNISEPAEGLPEAPVRPGLILLPVVGWAGDGTRLGRGGGYYDRLLSQGSRRGLTLVGLAYEWQRFDNLPRESWDVPLDYVITESNVITCEQADHVGTGKEVAGL